jgi:hypothetical protein
VQTLVGRAYSVRCGTASAFGTREGQPAVGGTGAYEVSSGSLTSDERRRTTVDSGHFDTD